MERVAHVIIDYVLEASAKPTIVEMSLGRYVIVRTSSGLLYLICDYGYDM